MLLKSENFNSFLLGCNILNKKEIIIVNKNKLKIENQFTEKNQFGYFSDVSFINIAQAILIYKDINYSNIVYSSVYNNSLYLSYSCKYNPIITKRVYRQETDNFIIYRFVTTDKNGKIINSIILSRINKKIKQIIYELKNQDVIKLINSCNTNQVVLKSNRNTIEISPNECNNSINIDVNIANLISKSSNNAIFLDEFGKLYVNLPSSQILFFNNLSVWYAEIQINTNPIVQLFDEANNVIYADIKINNIDSNTKSIIVTHSENRTGYIKYY